MDLLSLAKTYAKLKGTKILASAEKDDGTLTIVLASGPKLNFTQKQLEKEIELLTKPKIEEAEVETTPPVAQARQKGKK